MLTNDQVKKIAKLSSLELSGEELAKIEDQLNETLEFIEQLNQINTEKTEATHSVTGLKNVTRSDDTLPSLKQDQALQNTNLKQDGYFKVKAIFEEEM